MDVTNYSPEVRRHSATIGGFTGSGPLLSLPIVRQSDSVTTPHFVDKKNEGWRVGSFT